MYNTTTYIKFNNDIQWYYNYFTEYIYIIYRIFEITLNFCKMR